LHAPARLGYTFRCTPLVRRIFFRPEANAHLVWRAWKLPALARPICVISPAAKESEGWENLRYSEAVSFYQRWVCAIQMHLFSASVVACSINASVVVVIMMAAFNEFCPRQIYDNYQQYTQTKHCLHYLIKTLRNWYVDGQSLDFLLRKALHAAIWIPLFDFVMKNGAPILHIFACSF